MLFYFFTVNMFSSLISDNGRSHLSLRWWMPTKSSSFGTMILSSMVYPDVSQLTQYIDDLTWIPSNGKNQNHISCGSDFCTFAASNHQKNSHFCGTWNFKIVDLQEKKRVFLQKGCQNKTYRHQGHSEIILPCLNKRKNDVGKQMVPVQPPMCLPPGYDENVKNTGNHHYNKSKDTSIQS